MGGNGADVHIVLFQDALNLRHISGVGQHAAHVQMALGGDLDAVIADLVHHAAKLLQRQIAKLAGADIDGALAHKWNSSFF